MPLLDVSSFSYLSLFNRRRSSVSPLTIGSKELETIVFSFEQSIHERIEALYPPSISLQWLEKALEFLTFLHGEAENLISSLDITGDEQFLLCTLYIEYGGKILDLCNCINLEVESLRTRCLLLTCARNLVSPDWDRCSPERIRRAKEYISGTEVENSFHVKRLLPPAAEIAAIIRAIAMSLERLARTPRREASPMEKAVRRIIHSMGMLSVLLAGAAAVR